MSPSAAAVGRNLRALRHFRPTQVAQRVRLRAHRALVARFPEQAAERWRMPPRGAVGLPGAFEAIDESLLARRWDVDDLDRGSFVFLNERRELGRPVSWDPPDASHLWLFHHHYWEWAWALAAHPDQDRGRGIFAWQWRSWREGTSFGRWNAWAPYPVSLRAWVLVNVFDRLARGTDLEDVLVDDLALHAGFLAHNLELDLHGNHLVKNIKALFGLGVFLGREDLVSLGERHLRRELRTQVLPDGGHFELSPSYHCQVLGDLIDIAGLLAAAGRPPIAELDDAVGRMRRWLAAMVLPSGTVPMFNDGEPVPPALVERLGTPPAPAEPLTVLPDSGYVVVRRGPFHLVVDAGRPGPDELPAHAHADCLSFVLAVDGEDVVVDTGTSEYGAGPRRQFERSTAAHNTIEVDGTSQSEMWGAFRVGRRARGTLERAEVREGAVVVQGSHDGYRHLDGSPVHRRQWTVTDRSVTIDDTVAGSGRHRLAHRLTFSSSERAGQIEGGPGDAAAVPAERAASIDGPRVVDPAGVAGEPTWSDGERAVAFGQLRPAAVRELVVDVALPASFRCEIVRQDT